MAWHPWWPLPVHPHFVFEALGYAVGFHLLRRTHGRARDGLPAEARIWLLVAAVAGAAAGAKGLFWLEDPAATWAHRRDPTWLFGGRTIVGGFLGGWVAVEAAKRAMGIDRSTGDAFVAPMGVGLILGRIGCFLSGPTDGTWGVPTDVPWAMDAGDGVLRHPAPLYEIGWLALVLAALSRWVPAVPGDRFLGFMAAYLGFRFAVEFVKTQPALLVGLSAIQLACLAGLAYTAVVAWRRRR